MTDSRTILYIAAADADARDGAEALERAATDAGSVTLTVEWATDFVTIRERGPAVDCVVFAETPTTAAGAHLLEVIDACRSTPLVLYTDGSYSPKAAHSTDGVDGYVRRGEGTVPHLLDEIVWISQTPHDDEDETKALPEADVDGRENALLESLPEGVFVVNSSGRVTYVDEWIGRLLGVDAEHVRNVPLDALSTGETLSTADLGALQEAISRIVDGEESQVTLTVTVSRDDTETPLVLYVGSWKESVIVTARPVETVDDTEDDGTAIDDGEGRSEAVRARNDRATIDELHAFAERVATWQERAHEQTETETTEEETETHLFERALEVVGRLVPADRGWISVLEAETEADAKTLVPVASAVLSESEAEPESEIGPDSEAEPELEAKPESEVETEPTDSERLESIPSEDDRELTTDDARDALETGESVLYGGSDDVDEQPSARVAGSHLCVPIGSHGVLQVLSDDLEAFDERDRTVLELLAGTVASALARHRLEVAAAEASREPRLFEHTPAPALRYEVADGVATVEDVNPAFEEVFGCDRESVVGDRVEDADPRDSDDENWELSERLEGGEPHRLTGRRRTADETGVGVFDLTVVPLERDEDGHATRGVVVYTDVTEWSRRQRELVTQTDRLEEVVRLLDHDLRPPLNVARGFLELASETGDDDHFTEVDTAHEHISTLLDQLSTLARCADSVADTDPVSLHDLTRRAWTNVDTTNARLGLGHDTTLEAEESLLLEALENLIRNSVEHGRAPGTESEPITVRVSATETGFFVDDDGTGIPEAERERVFDVGYTTSTDASGLGLSVVERVAEAHGWTVRLGGNETGGARFVFDVRSADTETVPTASTEERTATAPTSDDTSREDDGHGESVDSENSDDPDDPRPRLHR